MLSVQVTDNNVASAGKVRVAGAGIKMVEANKWNEIEVDISDAGQLWLDIIKIIIT